MEVIEGRQKPRANERSAQLIKANERHLSEAEAIVGAFQKVLHEDIRPHEQALCRLFQASGRKVEDALLRPTWTCGGAQALQFIECISLFTGRGRHHRGRE